MGTVYVCAGGTGGHVFPAITVFEKLSGPKKFLTDERGMRFTVQGIDSRDLVLLKNVRFKISNIFKALLNVFFVTMCFLKNPPDCIVCFGGIVTIVPALIAKLFRARLIIHEQNIVMGRANRFLVSFADSVLLSYKQTKFAKSGEYSGMPVRSSIKPQKYSIGEKLVVAVIGGSQGSSFFTSLMEDVVTKLSEEERSKIKIFHQSRIEDARHLTDLYASHNIEAVVRKFFPDMERLYESTNLVIARAGSATLTEVLLTRLPAILIPLKDAMDNHQYENAKYYADQNVCVLLEESDECSEYLSKYLKQFIHTPRVLEDYHKCFDKIVDIKYGDLILEKVNEARQ